MEGWIKLHRQLLEWEWYDEPDTFRLFLHCLLKANHKDNNYRGQIVKAGSFLTSRDLLAKETGLSVQKIRTSLERLELTKELTTKKSKKGTVLQVVKYRNYQQDNPQFNPQFNQRLTNNQPTVNQQLTINNNEKNEKNEKNENKKTISFFPDYDNLIKSDEVFIRNLFQELTGQWTHLELNYLHRDLSQKLINYKAYCDKYQIKLKDNKHIKNSFRKFALSHWNKNTSQIRALK
tara:strand:- start:1934 stop:2635 length:702 start_codon:yes stop_codon:yes gene_type:complete